MSDKKTVKPAPKKEAAKENKTPTITGPDGKERPLRSGEVLKEVDGKVVALSKDEAVKDILAAKGMLISVGNKDIGTNTYGLTVKRCDNGNLLLSVETSDKPESGYIIPKKERCAEGLYLPDPRGIKVVGRRASMEAMYAMTSCYEAYTQNLGLTNAYALVRLELQNLGDGMKWHGLFVPALKVMEA